MACTGRKVSLYKFLGFFVVLQWLCGSVPGMQTSFKIYREERDVFKILNKCDSDDEDCTRDQCNGYNAECAEDNDCKFCRCKKGWNTFVVTKYEEDEITGNCTSDDEIVLDSVHEQGFELKHVKIKQCLKGQSDSIDHHVIGTECSKKPTLDMLWVWTASEKKQLMNVKTLKCMKEETPGSDQTKIIMVPCTLYPRRKMVCKPTTPFKTAQIHWRGSWLGLRYLSLSKQNDGIRCAISTKLTTGNLLYYWNKEGKDICELERLYEGCYRMSDGSFTGYYSYNQDNPINISAPIYAENSNCKLKREYHTSLDGLNWKDNIGSPFTMEKEQLNTYTLKSNNEHIGSLNGSLLKLLVVCRTDTTAKKKTEEHHCVFLKLESLPKYRGPELRTTTLPRDEYSSSGSGHTTDSHFETSTPESSSSGSSHTTDSHLATSPPESSSSGRDEKPAGRSKSSQSDGTNATAIAVPIVIILVILALVLGFLFYFRRQKRFQEPRNNDEDTRAVSSKDIYDEPEPIYETLREDGHEVPEGQAGTTSDTYNYPDSNGIAGSAVNRACEYDYAKNDSFTRNKEIGRGGEGVDGKPTADDRVYQAIEEEQPSSQLYNYVEDNTNAPSPREQEYAYAYTDTDLPGRNDKHRNTAPRRGNGPPANKAMPRTLKQEKPSPSAACNDPHSDDIARPGTIDGEYAYASGDIPRDQNKEIRTTGPATDRPAASEAMYHTLERDKPLSPEQDYSCAEKTDIAALRREESKLDHTSDESNGPNPAPAPVYSTLEEEKEGEMNV